MDKVKMVGHLVWILVMSLSSYMLYTDDMSYLNVTNVYFGIMITLGWVMLVLMGLIAIGSEDVYREQIEKVKENLGVVTYTKLIVQIAVMSLLQYEWLLGLNILFWVIYLAMIHIKTEEDGEV